MLNPDFEEHSKNKIEFARQKSRVFFIVERPVLSSEKSLLEQMSNLFPIKIILDSVEDESVLRSSTLFFASSKLLSDEKSKTTRIQNAPLQHLEA